MAMVIEPLAETEVVDDFELRISRHVEKGSVESTHKVPTSHYHTNDTATQWSRRSVD
jgi:hypothetical protein